MSDVLTCASCQMEAYQTFNEWTVCSRCGTILILDSGAFRKPTLFEWQQVLCDLELFRDLKEIQAAIIIRNHIATLLPARQE